MENLAVFVWEEVKKGIAKSGISLDILHEVEVYETKNISLSYRERRSEGVEWESAYPFLRRTKF